MNKKNLASWEKWGYSIIAAFIGGVATVFAAMVIAPDTFNFHDLRKLGELAVAAGIINVAMYLKQSPLPKLQIDDENETTTPTPTAGS